MKYLKKLFESEKDNFPLDIKNYSFSREKKHLGKKPIKQKRSKIFIFDLFLNTYLFRRFGP